MKIVWLDVHAGASQMCVVNEDGEILLETKVPACGGAGPRPAYSSPQITMKKAEHISACFDPPPATSPLAGVGPADVHNRAPRDFPLVSAGATVIGDGVLAVAQPYNVVFCQMVPWQCDYSKEQHNVKQAFRRASFLLTRLLGNMGVERDAGGRAV